MSDTDLLPLPPETRPLGEGGPEVSAAAWGMWRFAGRSVAEATRLVETALDAGITLFDTADIYGVDGPGWGSAESLLGEVFAANPGLRDRLVVATKGGIVMGVPYDSSPAYLASAIDASLARLQVDHVELWQIHRPDVLTHPEELARTLEDAVRSGKVGAVGVSNFTPAQIDALRHYLDIPLVSTQPEFSALHLQPLEGGQLDFAMRDRMTVLAWSPLGGGRIAAPGAAREQEVADALDIVANQQGISRALAAMSWIAAHPAHPIPIAGSQNAERIAELAKLRAVRWTRRQWYSVLTAARGEPLP